MLFSWKIQLEFNPKKILNFLIFPTTFCEPWLFVIAGWKGWDKITAYLAMSEMQDLIVELRSLTMGVGYFQRFLSEQMLNKSSSV